MSDTLTIPRANAKDVHIASEPGLLLVSGATATVTTIPGGITAAVNVPAPGPEFTIGAHYRVGGLLISGDPFSIPKAEFKGYGAGVLHTVATFHGMAGLPPA